MKKLVKSAIFGLYKYSGAMRFQEAMAELAGRSFAAVLLFHRVTDEIPPDGITVSTAWFRQICRMLQRSFRVVPLGEIFRLVRTGAPVPRRTVAITFDDSYRDNLPAAHVLAEHGLPACFFIPAGYVGTEKQFPWDRGLPRLANLSWDEVREMAGLGFEIGSHTVTHPNLAELTLEQTRQELVESKAILERQLERPVRWLAYPFGGPYHLRPDQRPLVAAAGYEGCVSACSGFIDRKTDPGMLPREAVPDFRDNLSLEMYLSGCFHWFYRLKRRLGLRKEDQLARSEYQEEASLALRAGG
jgi:peptidoglycan/xylan/chitin deacetylase (PgdA/CDA1 family)